MKTIALAPMGTYRLDTNIYIWQKINFERKTIKEYKRSAFIEER
ncbi:hypothetical protein SAMN05444481_1231 [Flavobacterium frigidimaris]|nr:hypothetical protein SAMN05444481_1231 [Flavobacterium frigidimaris]